MAFEALSQRLQKTLDKIRGKGKVSEQDVKEMMREVRLALLEADVNFKVVKSFVKTVSERAVGADVMKSLTPGQQIVKIVQDELTALMTDGEASSDFIIGKESPQITMMVGLQGAGKTTTTGKLANLLRKKYHRKPLLVAADIYRPAAINQLITLGKQLDIPVFEMGNQTEPLEIVKQALVYAKENKLDYIIIDTAGRLHIDETLMNELKEIKSFAQPQEVFLVVDAMTGQDAVNVAQSFDEALGVTGVVLTKLDGDTRGGAALSIRAVTGKPIRFTGQGEKLDAIEPFYPDRMVSRILGMGDVLSLIEKAQSAIDEEQALAMQKKMKEQSFTFDDFLSSFSQIKKMGPLQDIIKMIPGMNKIKGLDQLNIDDKQISHIEAIIKSMTTLEREDPSVINMSRRKRIAAGSGRPLSEVHRLIKQFDEMKKMMKQMSGFNMKGKQKGALNQLMKGFGGGNLPF